MYVISGATGRTGKAAAEALLAKGEAVRVIVRSRDKGEPWRAKGASVVIASLEDPAGLAEAFRGAKGAYVLVPPPGEPTNIVESRKALVRSIVEATKQSGLRHVVLLSSIGAQHDKGTGPIRIVHHAEQEMGKLDVALTSVRAAYFMENWEGVLGAALKDGVLPNFLDPDRKVPTVATKDIGETAAKALLEPADRQIIELSGPEEYSPTEVAAELSQIIGKQIALANVPREQHQAALEGAGVPSEMAALYAEMYRGIQDGLVDWSGEGTVAVRGRVPLSEVLAALVQKSA